MCPSTNAVNGRGLPTNILDANGVTSVLGYDAYGRLTSVTVNPGASQAVITFEYDPIGQVTKVIRPNGAFLVYAYDNARRLTSITNTLGEVIEFTYDLLGNQTGRKIRTVAGGTIVFDQSRAFDELGRLLRHIGAGTQTTTFAYDRTGKLKSVTDPRAGLYATAYDGLQRVIRETDRKRFPVPTLTAQPGILA